MYYDEFGYPVQDNDEGSLPPNEYMTAGGNGVSRHRPQQFLSAGQLRGASGIPNRKIMESA